MSLWEMSKARLLLDKRKVRKLATDLLQQGWTPPEGFEPLAPLDGRKGGFVAPESPGIETGPHPYLASKEIADKVHEHAKGTGYCSKCHGPLGTSDDRVFTTQEVMEVLVIRLAWEIEQQADDFQINRTELAELIAAEIRCKNDGR